MFALLLLAACDTPPPPVVAPEAHSWKDEAELVVRGLEDVQALWESGQKPAARTLADRVYSDRFEPRIEPALREMEGDHATAEVEYAFALLAVSLDGKDRTKVETRVEALERRVRAVAEAAERAFPPPGKAAAPPAPPKEVRPLVPDVPPAWEAGEPAADVPNPAPPPPAG